MESNIIEDERKWVEDIKCIRRDILNYNLIGDFDKADKLKPTLQQMERHARSRNWRLPE